MDKLKIVILFLLTAMNPALAKADSLILCEARDLIKREALISYSKETKTILIKENGSPNWKTVFDNNTACGRVSDVVCEHTAFDNLDDQLALTKQAYDSIVCSGKIGGTVDGQFLARFSDTVEGHFWCDLRGTRVYDYKFSNCSYQ